MEKITYLFKKSIVDKLKWYQIWDLSHNYKWIYNAVTDRIYGVYYVGYETNSIKHYNYYMSVSDKLEEFIDGMPAYIDDSPKTTISTPEFLEYKLNFLKNKI